MKIKLGKIYRHFKHGNLYMPIAIAIHSETDEKMVVYKALYGECKIFARPAHMWFEDVDTTKYPNTQQKRRFELVE